MQAWFFASVLAGTLALVAVICSWRPGRAEPDPDRDKTVCDCPSWTENWFAIINILNQPLENRTFYPKIYLSAMHEVFGVTLIVTWAITVCLHPEQIQHHPAVKIIGSFNPCFGWDYAPAANIALTCCAFNVYFGWRYAWLKLARNRLLDEPMTFWKRFNQIATISLAFSCNSWLNLWVIGPTSDDTGSEEATVDAWAMHTGIFVFYAFSAYLAVLGNHLDIKSGPRAATIETKHTVFLIIYGLSVFYLTLVYGYNLWEYEHGHPPALGSGWFTQVADFFWMGCLMTVTGMLPPEPPLIMTTGVGTPLPVTGILLPETALLTMEEPAAETSASEPVLTTPRQQEPEPDCRERLRRIMDDRRLTFVIMVLLLIDVCAVIAGNVCELMYWESKFYQARDALDACVLNTTAAACEDPGSFGDEFYHDAERKLIKVSIGILSVFILEHGLLLYANGSKYFTFHHILDFGVIVTSMVLELMAYTHTLHLDVGILIGARLWRFARIVHGGHAVLNDMEEDAKELKKLAKRVAGGDEPQKPQADYQKVARGDEPQKPQAEHETPARTSSARPSTSSSVN